MVIPPLVHLVDALAPDATEAERGGFWRMGFAVLGVALVVILISVVIASALGI